MKLLFDQNLSPRLVARLADLYPDSNHVYRIGIDRLSDEGLRDYARHENFVIVTKDSDFSDLCILLGFPPKWFGYVEGIAARRQSRRSFAIIMKIWKRSARTKSWEF